jgi:hypothetical protein
MNSSECDSANITQHTDYVIGCLAIILGVLVVGFNVILTDTSPERNASNETTA